ncbi:hypothetical protein POJ06DRAFT_143907 [Lipomyces tetrasporus]|uniref:Fatty acid hydroxylase domain-containing protein n=1 Tax=Lipomyces tetrasporus TaxID=54092 RepID=A0AAD7VR70_9ASCO|nr:uncharacterized protein POJ06DRAFT_143907 [Lipomyces tetrasporus]KAJ8098888.1 hypothetical protein POJ06DRAFT_143907 [Lipomyces tetrasporus]
MTAESRALKAAARPPVSVLAPRLVLGITLATAILWPSLYDPAMSAVYSFLSNSALYRFSGFETLQTVICYAAIEVYYTVKFTQSPSRRIDVRRPRSTLSSSKVGPNNPRWPRMRRPSRRVGEIVTYVTPLLMLDFTLIKKYADVSVAAIRQSGGYGSIEADGGVSASFLRPTVHNFTLASPLQLWRALPTHAPSSRRLVTELAVSLLIYDALFFFIHVAFHRVPVLAGFHKPHHRHGEINPQVTNQLSVVERLSLVLLANFALNIIKSHVLTRSAFIVVFVYLLVEVHSGLDLDWGYDKVLPGGWGAGARKHAMHHRDGDVGFAPFFCWWDNGLAFLDSILVKVL